MHLPHGGDWRVLVVCFLRVVGRGLDISVGPWHTLAPSVSSQWSPGVRKLVLNKQIGWSWWSWGHITVSEIFRPWSLRTLETAAQNDGTAWAGPQSRCFLGSVSEGGGRCRGGSWSRLSQASSTGVRSPSPDFLIRGAHATSVLASQSWTWESFATLLHPTCHRQGPFSLPPKECKSSSVPYMVSLWIRPQMIDYGGLFG